VEVDYSISVWSGFSETCVLECLEKTYRKLGYSIMNLHNTDRVHEEGVDLVCQKGSEEIRIQAKMKPRKTDVEQLVHFAKNTKGKNIYVYVDNPTKPFRETMKAISNVQFWDSSQLHKFLVENESIEYYCLYFSKHPLVLSLKRSYELIIGKRQTSYRKHKLSADELGRLWIAKDNSVKVAVSLQFIYLKWNRTLMAKTEKRRKEFELILGEIFKDLDMAYGLFGDKLVASIEDLSVKHPNLIGLFWHLVSQRTNWNTYTTFVDNSDSLKNSLFFTLYYWICPLSNESKKNLMSGFYSSMNYLLENLHDVAKDIEDGLDWVLAEATGTDL